jgi:hypothetical protein
MDMETTKVLALVSPSRGVAYTTMEALQKGIIRGAVGADRICVRDVYSCQYGSHDMVVEVVGMCPAESQWGKSVTWRFDGEIPIHETNRNDVSSGWGCGGDDTPEGDGWRGRVRFYLGEEEPEDVPVERLDGECRQLLWHILQRAMLNSSLGHGHNPWTDGPTAWESEI